MKEFDILHDSLKEIKGDIKDLEVSVSDMKAKLDVQNEKLSNLTDMNKRVMSLEKFRSRVKGIASAIAVFQGIAICYLKSKGII